MWLERRWSDMFVLYTKFTMPEYTLKGAFTLFFRPFRETLYNKVPLVNIGLCIS